jgi:hypothetical protein
MMFYGSCAQRRKQAPPMGRFISEVGQIFQRIEVFEARFARHRPLVVRVWLINGRLRLAWIVCH